MNPRQSTLNPSLTLSAADPDRPLSALPGPAGDKAAVALALPSVDEPWRYARTYAKAALGNLLGGHRLHADAARRYAAPVHISERLARRWRAVFDVPARAATCVPLLTNQSVGTLIYAQLFADLGINLRHLLHLRHRTTHTACVAACTRSRQQQLECHVQRVLRLGEDRVLVEVRTLVRDPQGSLLAEIEDGFVVNKLPPADLAGLPSDRALLRELLGLRRRLPNLSTTQGEALVSEMLVPADMGLAYGRLSGDMNPVHTSRLGARLFGLKRPFLQGLGLRNLVVRHLAELGVPTQGLQLTFAKPALLGQALLLVVDGVELEVHDAEGRLVAYGCVAAA